MPEAHDPRRNRVLVIRRRYLGDIVLLGSLFRNIKLHWPGSHITLLVEPPYAGVAALNPDVDATIAFSRGVANWLRLARELRRAAFTHVLDMDNTERTAILARITGAPFRAMLHLENVPGHGAAFYTHAAFVGCGPYSAQPITDTYLRILQPAGVPVATRDVRLVPREAELPAAKKLVSGPRPRVLVHPGSRSECRMWPAENFAAVCDRLQEDAGTQVFLVAGPGEESHVESIRRLARSHVVALPPAPGIAAFAAIAAQADAMLCHDSGPMHVAAAVGTPVVALFGSQNATVWRPTGSGHVVLQPPLPCMTCVAPERCVREDSYRNYCVRNIPVDRVVDAVIRCLRKGKP